MELIADRYEWPSPSPSSSHVLYPALDTLSGVTVSVLEARTPDEPADAAREADRLRRYAGVRHPHLAEVRTVEERASVIRVVCEPLEGDLLSDAGVRPAVRSVQRLAAGVLEALAALHRAGVTHGAVSARALLLSHRSGPTAEPDVTLLPVPLLPDRPEPGPVAPVRGPGPAGPGAATIPADDVRAAATVLLDLLRRTPRIDMGEAVLAASLERELERAGGRTGEAGGVAAGQPAPEPAGDRTGSLPAPGVAHPPGPGPARTPSSDVRSSVRRPDRAVMASRHRRRRVGVAAAVAAAGVGGLIAVTTLDDGSPTRAAPAAEASTGGGTTAQSPPSSVPEPAPAPPQTVAGLIADLAARPDAAGPAGPLLQAGLRGLGSEDEGLRQQSALQVLSIVIDDQGLDTRYATAARLALFRTMTGTTTGTTTGTAPTPSTPSSPSSCLEVRPGMPPAIVQEYARQVLDRLPTWQVDGFPADEAGRLRDLISPVAAGGATLGLRPCPAG